MAYDIDYKIKLVITVLGDRKIQRLPKKMKSLKGLYLVENVIF